MFCPRCGTQTTDTTKFCRGCGLPLTPLNTFVATGGTMPLPPPVETPKSSNPLVSSFQDLSPKQQLVLSILFFVFLPPLTAILSGVFHPLRMVVPLAGLLVPIGIVWSILHFKAQDKKRRLQRREAQNYQSNFAPPVAAPQTTYDPILPPLQTNPLYQQPNSVTEDETQRLPQTPKYHE